MPLSKLFDTAEDDWITILDTFLEEDVVEALLKQEIENHIEITEEIMDKISNTINSLKKESLILLREDKKLSYK